MKPVILGMTGASGIPYAVRVVQELQFQKMPVHLVISENARLVIREEMGLELKSLSRKEELGKLFGVDLLDSTEVFSARDFTAPIASGSFPVSGMIIVPCSMGTLAAVASGLSNNLIQRAADCVIKEGRRLVIVPRETPLSAIHLENMLKLARLGVRVVPAMPGFYSGPATVQDLIDFMAGKILDQLEIAHSLYPRWTGPVRGQPATSKAGEAGA